MYGITIAEAAEIGHCSRSMIWRLLRENKLLGRQVGERKRWKVTATRASIPGIVKDNAGRVTGYHKAPKPGAAPVPQPSLPLRPRPAVPQAVRTAAPVVRATPPLQAQVNGKGRLDAMWQWAAIPPDKREALLALARVSTEDLYRLLDLLA
jgi:hypothetical protein